MVHEFCRAVCDAAVIVTHHASGVGHMTACRTVGEADGGASARRRVSVRAQRAPAFDKLRARAVSLSNRTPKSQEPLSGGELVELHVEAELAGSSRMS